MIEEEGVCNFVYTTWWSPVRPFSTAPAIQQGFSRLGGVNLIASDGGGNGGGVFSNGNPLALVWHGYDASFFGSIWCLRLY